MTNEHTVGGLLRKRAEIAGQIEHAQRALNALLDDLDHIDNAIRIIDPTCDVRLVKPKRFPARIRYAKSELSRFVLDYLRSAAKPVSTLDITQALMDQRGLGPDDMTATRKRVGTCLNKLKAKGAICEVASAGQYKNWEIVR